jgi:peptidoglycan/LPS O-acetylase OafA/YrhL
MHLVAPQPSVDREREILPLTGLRALAAWAVVAFHFARGIFPEAAVTRVVATGHVAVDLFFVLSGFVLAHRYLPEEVAPSGRRAFWVRRFARVYPVYLASLAVGFAAEWPRSIRDLGHTSGLTRLAMQVALLNAWSHRAMFRLNWAAWSLSVEALMYLVFPWVLRGVARLSPRALLALLLACWAALFVAPAIYSALDPDHLGRPLARGDEVLWSWYLKFFPLQRLPEFVAGIAAALLARRWSVSAGLATATFLVSAAVFVGVGLSGAIPYAFLHSGVLLPLFLGLVVVLGVARGGAVVRALSSRTLVSLGHASYATYILHVPVFLLVARFQPAIWDNGVGVAAYMAGLAVVSLAAHRWFEEPLRRAIVRRWARPSGAIATGS